MSLLVAAGCVLLDDDNQPIEDVSELLEDGQVSRNGRNAVAGRCTLSLARELQWGRQRLAPSITLTSDDVEETWQLGVYVLQVPDIRAGWTPRTFEVSGRDLTSLLDEPYGSSLELAAGTSYLDAVADVLDHFGLSASVVADKAGKTLEFPKGWDPDDTGLLIVNELLGAVNYRRIFADRGGVLRVEPHKAAASRSPVVTFDEASQVVADERTVSGDYSQVPNWWRFTARGVDLPQEGDGRVTLDNQSDGPTSIDARGRLVRKVEQLDVSDQVELEAEAARVREEDMRFARRYHAEVSPTPALWHRSVVQVDDPSAGFVGKAVAEEWTLPLDGSDMRVVLEEVV